MTSYPDPPELTIAGQRAVIAVLREALDAERARANVRLAALAMIDGMRGREDADASLTEAVEIARGALEGR